METKLTETTLRNGQRAEVLCIRPPAGEWTDRIAPFLTHKGEPWNWHIRTNLEGNNDELEQRFFIEAIGDKVVSHLMVVEKHGLAILGHVFTDPDWREQGATTALMKAMTEDFLARDGVAMHLETGFDSQAFRIYGRYGFEPMKPGSGRMAWIPQPARFESMFGAAQAQEVRVERTCWTHWPLVQKLMIRDEGDWLRSAALSMAGWSNAEDAFVRLMSQLRDGPPLASAVLVNRTGMTVGLATLLPFKAVPGPMLQLDVYVHPTVCDHLPALIGAIELPPDRPVVCQIDSASPQRHQALRDAGLTDVGRLREAFTADGERLDLLIMQR